jgi:hypothetical protein
MTPERSAGESATAVDLSLPFAGRWLVRNSPARRVPSHGTDLFGERYAIDFVGVDQRGHTAQHRDWGTLFGTEPADRFVGFGRELYAPVDGTVTAVHDGEEDHAARRSQLALLSYVLGQAARVRKGAAAIAGNYVIIAISGHAGFVALAHLQAGSLRVDAGQAVSIGQPVALCGNSGNSTQPHLHLQVMDSADLTIAQGLPLRFRRYREYPSRAGAPVNRYLSVPAEGSIIEPLPLMNPDRGGA